MKRKPLSPPTLTVFGISLAIAIVAALANQRIVTGIPLEPVWIMGIGYAVLALGCLLRRV